MSYSQLPFFQSSLKSLLFWRIHQPKEIDRFLCPMRSELQRLTQYLSDTSLRSLPDLPHIPAHLYPERSCIWKPHCLPQSHPLLGISLAGHVK